MASRYPAPYTVCNEARTGTTGAGNRFRVEANVPAGRCLVVFVHNQGSLLDPPGPAGFRDTAGNTYVQAFQTGAAPRVQALVCLSLTAPLRAGTDELIAGFATQAAGHSAVVIARAFAGVEAVSAQAATPAATTSTAPSIAAGPITPAGREHWALGAIANANAGGYPGNFGGGFTLTGRGWPGGGQQRLSVAEQFTTAGQVTLTATIGNALWCAGVVTLVLQPRRLGRHAAWPGEAVPGRTPPAWADIDHYADVHATPQAAGRVPAPHPAVTITPKPPLGPWHPGTPYVSGAGQAGGQAPRAVVSTSEDHKAVADRIDAGGYPPRPVIALTVRPGCAGAWGDAPAPLARNAVTARPGTPQAGAETPGPVAAITTRPATPEGDGTATRPLIETSTAKLAPAGLAHADGDAPQARASVEVHPAAAVGYGEAPQPRVATAAFAEAPAGLASSDGEAPQPTPALTTRPRTPEADGQAPQLTITTATDWRAVAPRVGADGTAPGPVPAVTVRVTCPEAWADAPQPGVTVVTETLALARPAVAYAEAPPSREYIRGGAAPRPAIAAAGAPAGTVTTRVPPAETAEPLRAVAWAGAPPAAGIGHAEGESYPPATSADGQAPRAATAVAVYPRRALAFGEAPPSHGVQRGGAYAGPAIAYGDAEGTVAGVGPAPGTPQAEGTAPGPARIATGREAKPPPAEADGQADGTHPAISVTARPAIGWAGAPPAGTFIVYAREEAYPPSAERSHGDAPRPHPHIGVMARRALAFAVADPAYTVREGHVEVRHPDPGEAWTEAPQPGIATMEPGFAYPLPARAYAEAPPVDVSRPVYTEALPAIARAEAPAARPAVTPGPLAAPEASGLAGGPVAAITTRPATPTGAGQAVPPSGFDALATPGPAHADGHAPAGKPAVGVRRLEAPEAAGQAPGPLVVRLTVHPTSAYAWADSPDPGVFAAPAAFPRPDVAHAWTEAPPIDRIAAGTRVRAPVAQAAGHAPRAAGVATEFRGLLEGVAAEHPRVAWAAEAPADTWAAGAPRSAPAAE